MGVGSRPKGTGRSAHQPSLGPSSQPPNTACPRPASALSHTMLALPHFLTLDSPASAQPPLLATFPPTTGLLHIPSFYLKHYSLGWNRLSSPLHQVSAYSSLLFQHHFLQEAFPDPLARSCPCYNYLQHHVALAIAAFTPCGYLISTSSTDYSSTGTINEAALLLHYIPRS